MKKTNPFKDFFKLITGYIKQETVEPLKRLAIWAFWGFLGSTLVAIGLIFFVVGSIRLLQNETGSIFQGNYSWAPYFISIAGVILLGFLTFIIIKNKKIERN